jgi:hypothetical protein
VVATPHGIQLQKIACTAAIAARSVTCESPAAPGSGGTSDLIIGNQGTYVKLTSSNIAYDGGTRVFSFDVNIQNLVPQAFGTTDGATSDGTGVRVFFNDGPTVLAGTGTASVGNADGVGTFITTNQPFFQYDPSSLGADGILTTNEVSATKNWQLTIDPTVTQFAFTVYVSANVQFPNGYVDIAGASANLIQSGTQSLTATARTAVGNPVPSSTVTFASSAPAIAMVDATTGVVTGVAPGAATITATSSVSTTGSVSVQICPNLAVGESYSTSGASAGDLCLAGGSSGAAEYTVIPTNSNATSAVTLSLTASNIQAVTGPPNPNIIPNGILKLSSSANVDEGMRQASTGGLDTFGSVAASENAQAGSWSDSGRTINLVRQVAAQTIGGPYVPDDDATTDDAIDAQTPVTAANGIAPTQGGRERLMWYPTSESNVATTTDSDADASAGGNPAVSNSDDAPATTTMVAAPSVGDIVSYNTTNACSGSPSIRTGMVRTVSSRAVIVSDTANPAGGFTTAQYDSIGLEFDTIAYQVDAANFGTPTDVDANGHVILFFTRAVNELSPPASSAITSALFAQKDVFTAGECTNGNAAEVLYLLAPDPTGAVNSNVRTVSLVRGSVISAVGHEMSKMINEFGRHQRGVPFESTWLDESLGSLAEELMFYRTSVGLVPGQNTQLSTLTTGPSASRRVAAFNTYANQNFTRFRSWLQRPDTAGIADLPGSSSLARRGFGWAFLRYASDRRNAGDPAFVQSLVTSSDTGLANINGALGGGTVNDWIRDFVGSMYADDNAFSVGANLQNPSWNFRSVFGGLGGFPLATRPLTNNTPLTLSYARGNGASAYARLGVASGNFATVTLRSGASAPPADVQLMVIRTK